MKRNVLFILLMGMSRIVWSQGFDEWFEQKKTQLSYQHQQLAAMEAYDQATEAGYGIDQEETQSIASIQQQDTEQHRIYFLSLKTVNPVIRGSPAVQGVITIAGQIVVVAGQAERVAAVSGFFDGMLSDCSADIQWLESLTTDGALQLTDAQRMAAIDAVYVRMRARYIAAIQARNEIGLFLNH